MTKITIVFGYRNRDVECVARCFQSLKDQTINDFDVILVDYGSDENYSTQLCDLCTQYPFITYVFNNTRGMPWNRAHALNTGIRRATGQYIVTSDLDLVYSCNFIESFYAKLRAGIQFYKPVYWLPQFFNDWERLEQHIPTFLYSDRAAKGGVHIIRKDILLKINGFDEFYCYWGVEDRDLHVRTELTGIKTKWLSLEDAPVYHQWHPSVSNTKGKFFPDKWWDDMNIYFSLNAQIIKRNERGWGKIYEMRDRISLHNAETKTLKKVITVPEKGNSYTKAKIIAEIINGLAGMLPNESMLIKIPSWKEKKNRSGILKGIDRILFKITSGLVLCYKDELDLLRNRQRYLVPQADIIYVIWSLVKRHNIVTDYCLIEDDGCINFVISK